MSADGAMELCKRRVRELGYEVMRCMEKHGSFAARIFEVQALEADGVAAKLIYKLPPEDRRNEAALFRSLGGELAEWAPRIAGSFIEEPSALITYDAGEPVLQHFRSSSNEKKKQLLRAIVRRLAALHAATASSAEEWVRLGLLQPYPFSTAWAENAAERLILLEQRGFPFETRSLVEDVCAVAETFYPHYASSLRCPTVVTHGDLHMGNITDNGERLTFIDWEWANAATPVRDVAILLQDVEDDSLARYCWETYAAALAESGYEQPRSELENDLYRMLLDNTIMMIAWDVELYFMGEKREAELVRSLEVKRRRIDGCRHAIDNMRDA
jgi:hypothetical protein